MAQFPSSIPSYQGFTSTDTLAADNHAAQHNQEQSDISAIATKVGTGSSTPTNNTVLRGNGSGTTTYDTVHLDTDVKNVLATSNGGTGSSTGTGSGLPVFQTSPTITNPTESGGTYNTATLNQPTITDFTKANHTHTSAGQGGQLGFGALLSTIFSGQLQTFSNGGTAGGTGYYINLGGIKLMWVACAQVSSGNGANSYTITLPTFFTTIQTVIPHAGVLGVSSVQFCDLLGYTTSTITIGAYSGTNGSTQTPFVLVIGT